MVSEDIDRHIYDSITLVKCTFIKVPTTNVVLIIILIDIQSKQPQVNYQDLKCQSIQMALEVEALPPHPDLGEQLKGGEKVILFIFLKLPFFFYTQMFFFFL